MAFRPIVTRWSSRQGGAPGWAQNPTQEPPDLGTGYAGTLHKSCRSNVLRRGTFAKFAAVPQVVFGENSDSSSHSCTSTMSRVRGWSPKPLTSSVQPTSPMVSKGLAGRLLLELGLAHG